MNLLAMIYETTGKMQKRKNILNINNVIHDPCTPSLFANVSQILAYLIRHKRYTSKRQSGLRTVFF